jgi:hypothetical protein
MDIGDTFEKREDVIKNEFNQNYRGKNVVGRKVNSGRICVVFAKKSRLPDGFKENEVFKYKAGKMPDIPAAQKKYLVRAKEEDDVTVYFFLKDNGKFEYKGKADVVDYNEYRYSGDLKLKVDLRVGSEEVEVSEALSYDEDKMKQKMQNMHYTEFEDMISDLWSRRGWNTETTEDGGDDGIDVIARKYFPYRRIVKIQCKCYSDNNRVSPSTVREMNGVQTDRDDEVIVVTSGQFTSEAASTASDKNVKIINGDELARLIVLENAYDILADYI